MNVAEATNPNSGPRSGPKAERQIDRKRLTFLFLLPAITPGPASPAMAHLLPQLQRFVTFHPICVEQRRDGNKKVEIYSDSACEGRSHPRSACLLGVRGLPRAGNDHKVSASLGVSDFSRMRSRTEIKPLRT